MPESPAQRAEQVLALCRDLGFSLAGIADAAPTRWGRELTEWLAAGKHGSMSYLAEHVAPRLDPKLVLPGARAAIMVADRYAARGDAADPRDPRRGRVARYARGRDYHEVIKKRLHALADALRSRHPDAQFRTFVDTAPVLEREYAARAGLGWVAKNSLLISPRAGSYLLLGGLLTTLELVPSQEPATDHCGTCTRCIDACPTAAITSYSVDARRCISYLTIEHRGPIDAGFFKPSGDWLYGCDLCQEVCPHNSARAEAGEPVRDEYRARRDSFDLLEVLGWSETERRSAFESSAMKRATLAMMRRNALIVAGNALAESEQPELLGRIRQIADDEAEPELVRGTANEVLARLSGGGRGLAGGPGPGRAVEEGPPAPGRSRPS